MLRQTMRLVVVLIFCVFSHSIANAQLPQISSGINYLTSSQNTDGTWDSATTAVDGATTTGTVLETLQLLNQTAGATYTNGAAWLQGQTPSAVALMAQRQSILGLTDAASLIAAVDPTKGGWGGASGYETNPLDTSLALQALKAANYTDLTVINSALAYLTGSQNADGGWGFNPGAESNIYLTAIVSATLQQFPQTTVIATAVSKATSCLLAAQNPDGSFGPEATVYDTALALIALLGNGQTQDLPLQNAVNSLTSNQATNGSWNDDPYATALALKALYLFENRPAPPPPPPAAGKFTGTVLDAATRQGVSGVSIVLEGSLLTSTVTDSAGNFTLADVPPGAQKLAFSLTGYAATSMSAVSVAAASVNLGAIAMTSANSTGTVAGTIRDPGGNPLADVVITVSGAWSGSAVTGPDGSFSFAFVTPGDVAITAAKAGYQSFSGTGRVYARTTLAIYPRLFTAPSQATTGAIVGRVVGDLFGFPIDHLPGEPGVLVTISGGAAVEPNPDNGGSFSFQGLAPNTYQVTVGMSGFVSQTFRLIIAPGVTTDLGTIRLVMSADTISLTGKVTDKTTGLPIPSAEVVIAGTGLTARADFAGSYVIADIPQLQFTVKASAAGYVGKSVYLYQGGGRGALWAQQLDIALTPLETRGKLTGTVVDAATGQPLDGALLTLASNPGVSVTTDNGGAFTFGDLPQGVQQTTIAIGGYASRILTTVILPGTDNNVGSIPLSPEPLPAVVQGRITDGITMVPLGEVRVASSSGTAGSMTAANGSYALEGIAPGNVTITAACTGYFSAGITAPLEAGGIMVFSPALFSGLSATAGISVQTDKPVYAKGDRVSANVSLLNLLALGQPATLRLQMLDPAGATLYETSLAVELPADGTLEKSFSFPLPPGVQGGNSEIMATLYNAVGIWIGSASQPVGVAVSRITVTPQLPAALAAGANPLSFSLANSGDLAVSSGILAITLKDPDGQVVAVTEQPFTLGIGEVKTVSASISLPQLKFGDYLFSYAQSDESRTGRAIEIKLANSMTLAATFDSNSHRVRNTAGLTLSLVNSGSFNQEAGTTVTVSLPDADFSETRSLSPAPTVGSTIGSSLLYHFQIPATMTAGEHNTLVTVTLPSGSTTTQRAKLVIFDATLSLTPPHGAYVAGETISLALANSGGVDASLQYRLSLVDAKGSPIAEKSRSETALAGASLTLDLPIPLGAVDGSYNLLALYKNLTTGREELVNHPVAISGVKGTLQVATGKQSYLSSEEITSRSAISTSGTSLQDGTLHLQIAAAAGEQQQTWTSQYDFQQGVRDGVDTYGVNDWLIPDDDFAGATLDQGRWTAVGNVALTAGKVLADSAAGDAFLASNWQLEGDFDLQVDFEANNSVLNQGAELVMEMGAASVFIKNSRTEAYSSGIRIADSTLNSQSSGAAAANGKLRISRSGDTVVSYYWSGSAWLEVARATHAELAAVAAVKFGMRQGAGATSAVFDNFAVNSGRLATQRESVDSVRLLPINDNFDHGFINEDRWQIIGTLRPEVSTGTVNIISDQASWENGLVHRVGLPGDCSAVTKYRDYAAQPYEAIQGRYIMWLTTKNTNIYINRQSDRLSRASGQFLVALSNINGWYQMSGEVPYGSAAGLFRLRRQGNNGFADFWDGTGWNTLHSRWGLETTPATIKLTTWSQENMPAIKVGVDYFNADQQKYTRSGTIRLKQDAGLVTTWQNISWNATAPSGTSLKLRTRTAADEAGLATAPWSDYLTASGSPITSPPDRWIEVEATLTTTDTAITPLLHDVTVTYGKKPGDILWQADIPVNLVQGGSIDLSSTVGSIGTAGKYYLRGTLFSSTGQSVARADHPFYVVQGNTLLTLTSDKRVYRPGETVTISGEVTNRATIEASGLALVVKGKAGSATAQNLYADNFTIPAGGSRLFQTTTKAGSDGVVILTAAVMQNTATLAAIADQFEVASPKVTASLGGPDTAGREPFALTLTLANNGKANATITVTSAFGSPEVVTLPAGQIGILRYQQQIGADTTYEVTLSGDLSLLLTKRIVYVPPKQPATLATKLVTDKISYRANENVSLAATISCQDAGTTGDNLFATLVIADSGGRVLFTENVAIPAPVTGWTATFTRLWNSATSPAGDYRARLVVEAGGLPLTTVETTFTLLSTATTGAGTSGTLAAAVTPVYLGIDQSLAVSVTNNGNEDLPEATYRVIVVNPDTGESVQTYIRTVAIPRQGTFADRVTVPTTALEERNYLAVLQLALPGMAEARTLAGAPFAVTMAPPPTLAVSTLANGAVTNNPVLNITGSVSGTVAIGSCAINGTAVPLNADGSFSHALLLQTGDTAVKTVATDILGHTATDNRTITLDQRAPSLTIDSPADNSTSAVSPIEVTGSVDETTTVTIRTKDNIQTASMNGKNFSATIIPEPRWNTIEITATDLAGNSSSQKRSVLFDDQKPALAIIEPGQDIRTNKERLTIAGTASDPFSAVGITVAVGETILTPPVLNGSFSQVVSFGEEQLYPITVTATNEVGTQTVVQRNIIYDRTPPVLTIDPVTSPTNAPQQTVTGTREEGTSVTCSCTTAIVGAVAYPTATSWQAAVSGLAQGENRLRAETTDLAGNLTIAAATIQYVPRAPDVTISTSSQTLWPPNKKLVAVTITGNVVTYGSDIRDVSISVADEYGTYNQQGLKFNDTVLLEAWREGNDKDGRIYTITAVVTDQAGNRTARSTTVVVPHDQGK